MNQFFDHCLSIVSRKYLPSSQGTRHLDSVDDGVCFYLNIVEAVMAVTLNPFTNYFHVARTDIESRVVARDVSATT